MSVDSKLVQQVRAAAKKPRNFFFAPGKDNGILLMSPRKIGNAEVAEAKKETGATKIVKGIVKVVDGELVFENTTHDDKATETKLRKTLKLNTGLTQKMQLVKVASVVELDQADDDSDAESASLSDDEQVKLQKAEYKQRRTDVARQVDQLRLLMPQKLNDLNALTQQIAGLENDEDYRKGIQKLEKLEVVVKKLLSGADKVKGTAVSDAYRVKVAAVKTGVNRICKWHGVDINVAQMKDWNTRYEQALDEARVFKHDLALSLLSGVESEILAAELLRVELDSSVPRLWALLNDAKQSGQISKSDFEVLDAKLVDAEAAMRALRLDDARSLSRALQTEVAKVKGEGRLYKEAAVAVKGLLDGLETELNAKRQGNGRRGNAGRAQLVLTPQEVHLSAWKAEYEQHESLAKQRGVMDGYMAMTGLEAKLRSHMRTLQDVAEQHSIDSISLEADDRSRGAEMVEGKSLEARTLKLKLDLDSIRKALPMLAGFDPAATSELERGIAGVEQALQRGAGAAEAVLPTLVTRFKEIFAQMQAARNNVPERKTVPVRPNRPAPSAKPPVRESTEEWTARIGDVTRYQVGPILGGGAKGSARLMTDPNDRSAPALVVKHTSDIGTAEIQKEADNYKKLGDHPNIAKCLGVRNVGGKEGIVMEAVQGKSAAGLADNLRARLAAGEISQEEYWSTVQYTLSKTLEGLVHMHKAGFTHNDIKPDNVMVDKNTGEVKLIDMGGVEAISTPFQSDGSEFTQGYAAPDRFTSSTPQTDAFSAGASAYSMAEGSLFDYKRKEMFKNVWGNADFEQFAPLYQAPEEAMTPADQANPLKRQVDAKGRDLDDGTDGIAVKEAGRYAGKTAYVDLLNSLMHPDPNQRISPEEALQHPFLRDRTLDDEKVKAVVQRTLGTSDSPKQHGKEPERARLDKLMAALPDRKLSLKNGQDALTAAAALDIARLPPEQLVQKRGELIAKAGSHQTLSRMYAEPVQLLQRIVESATVTDDERHVNDRKTLDQIRQISQLNTRVASALQDLVNQIDGRIANGDLVGRGGLMTVGFSAQELATRVTALNVQRAQLQTLLSGLADQPNPELSVQLDNVIRIDDEVSVLRQQAAAERALMQTVQQALLSAKGPAGQRTRAQAPNVASMISELDTRIREIDQAKLEVDRLKTEAEASAAKIAAALKVLQRALGSQVIRIKAHFEQERASAQDFETLAKGPRSTAAQAQAFEVARAQFDTASKQREVERQAIRAVTEKAIAQLNAYKATLGPTPLAKFPNLLSELDVEIGRLRAEPRLFSEG